MSLCHGASLGRVIVVDVGCRASGRTRDRSGETESDPTLPHLRESDRALALSFAAVYFLSRANRVDRTRQIAIPLERVHRQVEVGIDQKHGELQSMGRVKTTNRKRGRCDANVYCAAACRWRAGGRSAVGLFGVGGLPSQAAPFSSAGICTWRSICNPALLNTVTPFSPPA